MTIKNRPFKIGKIHGKKAMFLRIHVGKTKSKNGTEYEMSIHAKDSSPIIFCEKTKRWFTLSWADILNLARESGIGG